jgi:ferrochelatase
MAERAVSAMNEATDKFDDAAHAYDAVLVVSFGGPEGPNDVEPFLDNVLRGLPIRPESRTHIAQRYQDFGGVSPINAEVRAFIAALRRELDSKGPALPIYWGNRNWQPMLDETFAKMQKDGIKRAIAFVTSMFSSYSGCRKYREDLYAAASGLESPPVVDKLRLGFNHPRFVEAWAARVSEALADVPETERSRTLILFSAHSLPESMAQHCRYEAQLDESCQLVADALEHTRWRLVYQSNNASYGRGEWLGPDISDAIRTAHAEGTERVIVAPIGFVCDHMEVIIDLDIEAAAVAKELGVEMIRAKTVGTHPAYVAMVRELIVERMAEHPVRPALGSLGPNHDICPSDCCLSGRPGPTKPAACGSDSPGAP